MEKTETLTDKQLEGAFKTFMKKRNEQADKKQQDDGEHLSSYPLLAWETCITRFADAFESGKSDTKTVDALCKCLNEYLVCWGMTRNSNLTREHYEEQEQVVRAILKFPKLCGKNPEDFCDEYGDAYRQLYDLYETLKGCCAKFSRAQEPKASGTLISKTILGTLGIVPGYDQKVRAVLKKYGITTGSFNMETFKKFACYFTKHHVETIATMTEEAQKLCPLYTRAKVIDSLLWFIG
ncbi:MAG: hypothetical protein HDR35_06735 [Treponema sp.]|nr:hypothetical protein [Treponema sp.]